MNKHFSRLALATLTVVGTLGLAGPGTAQVAGGTQDIAQGKTAVTRLEKKLSMASADAKAKAHLDLMTLQSDLKSAEAKLADLKQAGALHWKEFETEVNNATSRLRKSSEKAAG